MGAARHARSLRTWKSATVLSAAFPANFGESLKSAKSGRSTGVLAASERALARRKAAPGYSFRQLTARIGKASRMQKMGYELQAIDDPGAAAVE